jgi:hypothetical protein
MTRLPVLGLRAPAFRRTFTASARKTAQYAPYAVDYLLNGEDILFGRSAFRVRPVHRSARRKRRAMYTAGELRHIRV